MKNKFSLNGKIVLLILGILLKEINTQHQNEHHYNAASNLVSEYNLNKLLGERSNSGGADDEFRKYSSLDTSKKYHDLKKNVQKLKIINVLNTKLIGLFFDHKLDKLESTK